MNRRTAIRDAATMFARSLRWLRTGLLGLPAILAAATPVAAERPMANYDEARVARYTLPELLTAADGSPVRTADDWSNKRRGEVLELFRSQVYGRSPTRPEKMRCEVVAIDEGLLLGRAVRKRIRVYFDGTTDGPRMDVVLWLPADAEGPTPVFLGVLLFDRDADDPVPGVAWQRPAGDERDYGPLPGKDLMAAILARGYGVATLDPEDIAPDDGERYDDKLIGALRADGAERSADEWGAIGAWAWALSRALDCLAEDDAVDAGRTIAIGHSRRGKTALWAGAQDERFAIVISNNSGCGGAALSRRRFGETVRAINDRFPHWFCLNFRRYNDNEDALPVDQHGLIALIAPRPVYVASASEDQWADPRGEFLAALAAEPVYRLLGRGGLDAETMPAPGEQTGDVIGYHYRPGAHALTDYDWMRYLDFADRHLRGRPAAPSGDNAD